jgi:hypothetical protein
MLGLLRQEAAQLWVGLVAQCGALAAARPESGLSAVALLAAEMPARLRACLLSGLDASAELPANNCHGDGKCWSTMVFMASQEASAGAAKAAADSARDVRGHLTEAAAANLETAAGTGDGLVLLSRHAASGAPFMWSFEEQRGGLPFLL